MEAQITSIPNRIKTTNSNMSKDFSTKSSGENFSDKFEDAFKSINAQRLYNSKYVNTNKSVGAHSDSNNTLSELEDVNADNEKEIIVSQENLIDEDSKLNKKVKEIITDLFKGKIDYSQFQEETNKLSIDDSRKNQLFDVVSSIITSEEFVTSNALTTENINLNNIVTTNKGEDDILNSLMALEKNSTDKEFNLDKKLTSLIGDLLQGKINFNKVQEEINKLPIDDGNKIQLLDVISKVINNEASAISDVLTSDNINLNSNVTAAKRQDSILNFLIATADKNSANEKVKSLNDISTDNRKEVIGLKEVSTDKDTKLDGKVSNLISALFQDKIDYSQLQEEINKLPMDDGKKAQLLDVIAKVINSKELATSNVLSNDVNTNRNIYDDKSQDSILKSLVALAEREKDSVNEKLKSLNYTGADTQKKIMALEEPSADKDTELDKKVSSLISALFQGKINYSQLQEEINKMPMDDGKNAKLLDVISKVINTEELTNLNVLSNNVNTNRNIDDDKSQDSILKSLVALVKREKGSVNEKLESLNYTGADTVVQKLLKENHDLSLKDIGADTQKKIMALEEPSADKDTELDKKVSNLISALFQGKINYSQVQEEINKLPMDDSKKIQLLDVVSTIAKSELLTDSDILSNNNDANKNQGSMLNYLMTMWEKGSVNEKLKSLNDVSTDSNSINKKQNNILDSLMGLMEKEKSSGSEKLNSLRDVLNNVTQALTAAVDDKKDSSKIDLIQKLQSMVKNISEEVDNHTNSNSSSIKYQSIDTLLSARYIAARGNSSEGSDTSKKNNSNIEDILTSLTQKKSDNNDTAMLKINGLVNSLNNENSNVFNHKITGEPMVINKNNMVDDVIKSIKFMDTNKIKELTVKINPKELGEVVIKLVAEGNAMRATIQASNKEAYNLLNSQLNEISKNVQDIKIQEISIGISQEDTTYFANQSNDQSQGKQQNNKQNRSSIINNISADLIEEELPIIDSNINALA